MAVDPSKPRIILVVHGVQCGTNADLNQHRLISTLLQSRLGNMPLPFQAELFRYEDINDQAQQQYSLLLSMINALPKNARLTAAGLDLTLDVVTAIQDQSTAAKIRQGLVEQLLAIYAAGNPCYVVAHSLGSIYAFDVINQLIAKNGLFERNSRRTWPVQGLMTLGSPIGLSLFKNVRLKVSPLGAGTKWLRWLNYWDPNDPIVSGRLFGETLTGFAIAEQYRRNDPLSGWAIRDQKVNTGQDWLMAHIAYWQNPMVGDGLFDLIVH